MARTMATSETRPLAAAWTTPAQVFDSKEGAGRPLACIATTYTFSAELFETDLLPRFLGLEFDPAEREPAFLVEREDALAQVTAAVLVDQHKVDVHQTTLRWDQVPVRVPRGIQHAKLTLLAWERAVRLIIGSANLTIPGYRHNREMAAVLDFADQTQSTPRAVLDDALAFIERVLGFAAAEPRVLERLRSSLGAVAARVRRWERMPKDFTAREYPQVHFVPTLPHPRGGPFRSTLKQVRDLWGNKPARDIRVVTPFVGNAESSFQRLTEELAKIPHIRYAAVSLAAPGTRSEAVPSLRRIALPARFRDAWAAAWKTKERTSQYVRVVIPDTEHRGRPVQRPLHAKALFVGDGSLSLLLCGSSNFSAAGMGVNAANIEANLCYLDRDRSEIDGRGLEDRLPVEWGRTTDVQWPEVVEPPEEDAENANASVPPVFAWATFDPTAAQIVIGLNLAHAPPAAWEVRLSYVGAEPLASHEPYPVMPPDGRLVLPLPPELVNVPVTTLRVRWVEEHTQREALLPVHVEDRAQLPPPEALRSLTAEGILACILSGCDPAEWVGRQIDRSRNGSSGPAPSPDIDPHRFHDPSGLALYKVRRLGRALAAMGQRLVATVRTPEAVEYHVHRHPLGPVRLAEALVQEGELPAAGNSGIEHARLAFSLVEIGLMLAHAGKDLHRRRQAGEMDHRPCFRRAVQRVLRQANSFLTAGVPEPAPEGRAVDSLRRYRSAVEGEARVLLGGLYTEEEAPCL
jgi:hypothetical protein